VIRKKFSVLMVIAAALWMLLVFAGTLGATAVSGAELAREIDDFFNQRISADGPGAVVLAVKDGRVVLRRGYGLANMELGVPLKPEMVFRIGSITKQFTSAGIMMLLEEGRISLNDEITKFLPDYPTGGNKITIHSLLNHTSGIKSYDDIQDFYATIRNDFKPAEFVGVFKNEPLDFKPGEQFKYNNSGYFLLGVIIEKVSGKAYEEFIDERIFKPLGMKSSYYGSHSCIIPNRATGYQATKNGYINADYISMSQFYAGGALLSTADDLWTWTKALHSGKVVSPKSFKRMTTATKYAGGQTQKYGYGLWLNTLFGEQSVEHGGGINGFITHVLYLPEKNIFVTVLTNAIVIVDAPFAARWTAALLSGKDVKRKKAVTLDSKILDEIVGVYEIPKGLFLTVTREGNGLYSQRSGGGKSALFASSESEFFYENSFAHFTIVRDKDGQVVKMVIHDQGPDVEAVKTDRKPTERKTIQLAVRIFNDYVGLYESEEGIEMAVKQRGGNFYAQLKGQPEFEIFPESQNKFFFKVADAQLEFVRDAGGKVTGLTLHQGGRSLEMRRDSADRRMAVME
jgi:CubicO group peptidase (beta-lactamase class C family)